MWCIEPPSTSNLKAVIANFVVPIVDLSIEMDGVPQETSCFIDSSGNANAPTFVLFRHLGDLNAAERTVFLRNRTPSDPGRQSPEPLELRQRSSHRPDRWLLLPSEA